VLGDHDRRALDELQLDLPGAARPTGSSGPDRPQRRRARQRSTAHALVVVVGGPAFLLLIVGAGSAALALATAVAVGWSSWRYWPLLDDRGGVHLPPRTTAVAPSVRRAGTGRTSRYLERISEEE
jgi:hypothetical protein